MDGHDVFRPAVAEKIANRAFVLPGANVSNDRRIEFGVDIDRQYADVVVPSYGGTLHRLGDGVRARKQLDEIQASHGFLQRWI